MTEKTKQVFYCDYCKKHVLTKHAMIRHEYLCTLNPSNKQPCTSCIHLEMIEREVIVFGIGLGVNLGVYETEIPTMVKNLHCKKLDKILMTFQMHEKGLSDRYPNQYQDAEVMPKECADFKLF